MYTIIYYTIYRQLTLMKRLSIVLSCIKSNAIIPEKYSFKLPKNYNTYNCWLIFC